MLGDLGERQGWMDGVVVVSEVVTQAWWLCHCGMGLLTFHLPQPHRVLPTPSRALFLTQVSTCSPVPSDMQVASLTPPSRAVSVQECCSGCSRTVTDGRVQGVQPPWEGGKGPAPVGRGASSWASPGPAQVGFAAGAASPGPL